VRNALPPDPSTHSLSPNADQIKAITGHKSLSEVVRYTKAADQARLARQAIGDEGGASVMPFSKTASWYRQNHHP